VWKRRLWRRSMQRTTHIQPREPLTGEAAATFPSLWAPNGHYRTALPSTCREDYVANLLNYRNDCCFCLKDADFHRKLVSIKHENSLVAPQAYHVSINCDSHANEAGRSHFERLLIGKIKIGPCNSNWYICRVLHVRGKYKTIVISQLIFNKMTIITWQWFWNKWHELYSIKNITNTCHKL